DTLLAPGQLWSRALQVMDDPLPSSCEHVRRGAGMHCLVYESIWHVIDHVQQKKDSSNTVDVEIAWQRCSALATHPPFGGMWQLKSFAQCALFPALVSMLLALQGCDHLAQVQTVVSNAVSDVKHEVESLLPGSNQTKKEVRMQNGFLQPSNSQPSARMNDNAQDQEDAIPLAATSWSGGPRLLMEVSPVGANGGLLPAQRLVVDTGSSTLAFCQSSFLQEAAYQETNFISCNLYNPGGSFTGYWGPFVAGQLHAGSVTFQNSFYSIMVQEAGMPCRNGIDGIFGIAFRQLDVAYPADERPDFGSNEGAECPEAVQVLPPPMIQKLRSRGGVEKLGIYWSGQLGENQGMLYLDNAAVTNEHYDKSSMVGPAVLGEVGWYDIAVQKMSVGDQEFTGFGCAPSSGQQCIMDTGTPSLVLPAEVFDSAVQLIDFGESATLTFWLPGISGEAVAVSFDLQALNTMGALSKAGEGTNLILGLPLWAFYYTVFDISGQSVSFIRQTQAPTQETPWESEPIEPTEPLEPPLNPTEPSEPSPGPFQPFQPGPWVPIPRHEPGSLPAPESPLEPFGPFQIIFEETANSSAPGEGRRMEELPVHV
ncbi:unnamed protein product, partial [Symbiodinium sp. CCMP2456]